jgi:hypothetical protein
MDLTLPSGIVLSGTDLPDMLAYNQQLENEQRFSTKHINADIDAEMRANPQTEIKVKHGVELLTAWVKQSYYDSKNNRLKQLDTLSFEELVREVFTNIAYLHQPEQFVAVAGQMAIRMGFATHKDSIVTVSEIIALLAETDAFDIEQDPVSGSMYIQNTLPFSAELIDRIVNVVFLPPMVCPPELVTSNFESGYLTHNDSLILGKGNSHTGDICLDVISKLNQTALELNAEFIDTVYEEPNKDQDKPDSLVKIRNWDLFVEQSHEVYALLIQQGKQFWLTHKVDKRGRIYAMGYHVSTQGSAYKKAMIDLAKKELVGGVPT